ncbi:MAG: CPBP family glutamic-type intramembrane protease [SAR324 cluster bacterium]|nr:CPBP family glutamic-type intramembrane protease [SAR324 cluster bacterium]
MLYLGWVLLVSCLPLVLLAAPQGPGLSALAWRIGLFHGAGLLCSVALISAEGLWPRWRALLARPARGLLLAIALYLLPAALVTLFLLPLPGPLPAWARAMLLPFDFGWLLLGHIPPLSARWLSGKLLLAAGSAAEEWIFRCALWLRWAGPFPERSTAARGMEPHLYKLFALSLYFSLLHFQHGAQVMAQALAGSLVLGALLMWRRNFTLIATLHVLFNWGALRTL